MIGVIDTGLGNLASLTNMFRRLQVPVEIASTPEQLLAADRLVLPGVGAYDHGVHALSSSGLKETLEHEVLEKRKPILGICLGMQLLTKGSEEGNRPGLGWLDAQTVRFDAELAKHNLRVPHMGWNHVQPCKEFGLLSGYAQQPRFYFVHSYHVVCQQESDVLAVTHYGEPFVSAVQKANIVGVQFHPEKSHKFGMRLLQCFAEAPEHVFDSNRAVVDASEACHDTPVPQHAPVVSHEVRLGVQ